MPRFNVEHNGKWACYSGIADGFITVFMDKVDYEEWRLEEYGRENYVPAEQCNMFTMAEAVGRASLYSTKEDVINDLVNAGLERSEAEALYEAHRKEIMPVYEEDPEEEKKAGEEGQAG